MSNPLNQAAEVGHNGGDGGAELQSIMFSTRGPAHSAVSHSCINIHYNVTNIDTNLAVTFGGCCTVRKAGSSRPHRISGTPNGWSLASIKQV